MIPSTGYGQKWTAIALVSQRTSVILKDDLSSQVIKDGQN